MPDRFESETRRRMRREHPEIDWDEETERPQTYTPPAKAQDEPEFNSDLGKRIAERMTDKSYQQFMGRWHDRIKQETGGQGVTYLQRMRSMDERAPEIHRLYRSRLNAKW